MSDGCNSITHNEILYIRWINTILGSCINGNQELLSNVLGFLSIACWLNAQFPQLLKNYKNKSTNGLSLPFLTNWLLGDIANLLGCILTDQLTFQKFLAAYFCMMDLTMYFQYFYYTWFRTPIKSTEEDIPVRPLSVQSLKDSILEGAKKSYTFPIRKNQSHQRVSSMVFAVLLFTFHSTSSISSSFSTSSHFSTIHDEIESQNMSLGGHIRFFFENNSKNIGRIMAWACTVLYLTSRMPQIWENYTRRSVEGLSIFMFIFAALGNFTYTMSIFTNPEVETNPDYLPEAVPYVLGSIGTLTFDVTIFIQWCILHGPENRHRRLRSRRSSSYDNDSIVYHQLLTDDGSYRGRRYNNRGSVQSDGDIV